MTRTVISYGNSCLIALLCASNQDLENISRCFYNELQTPRRCPYAIQAPRLQMLMIAETSKPTPRPCRIHAVNGGRSLPLQTEQKDMHYYDFAIVGECDDLEFCLDTFLEQMGLVEVKKSSYMSEDELSSFMKQYLGNSSRP